MIAEPPQGERPGRSPGVATFLSFLWPGLGHWYLGRRRAALVFAVPVVVVAAIVAWKVVSDGPARLAIDLFSPSLSQAALVLIVLLAGWRLVAMGHAITIAGGRRGWRRPREGAAFVALALAVLLVHGVAGYYALSFYDAGTAIFVNPGAGAGQPAPSVDASTGEQDVLATPIATPQSASSRITILLTGIDSSPGRNHALNDTILVVSVDRVAHTAAMVSFPRDIANFPMWNGGTFTGKINALMTAAQDRSKYPDGPINTLVKELAFLLGTPIHYFASIDLQGFVTMVDAVGGVDIDNQTAIDDPGYGGWTDGRPIGFKLSVGRHHLDGQEALAFVRTRRGAGDNDFNRARRQQQLLVALEKKMSDPQMLPRLPSLIKAAGSAIRTDFPADQLGDMLDLARLIGDDSIQHIVLGPSKYASHPPNDTTGGVYTLKLDLTAVAQLSVKLFGSDSRYYGAASSSAAP